ncbi:MAG: tungstate ABC transporter substrate-binding protein WtpA [Candidatus Hecatellales archaeon]|nr:MAG: tungstate ABC transporter substrate-binding protein WtpA [Candidatus Hecatellales archaeon]
MRKTATITLVVIVFVVLVAGIFVWQAGFSRKTLKVFHAGSLTVPFERLEERFEGRYSDVDVQRVSGGSVMLAREIVDVGERADVYASADYSLIPKLMYPKYANWTVMFARNEMVLAYNPEKSRYADEVNSKNWYNILRRKDVTFGFSNPNLDPCGYRTLIVIQLAELYYNDSKIFDDLILSNTAITISEDGGVYHVKTPENLKPNTAKLVIKPKSVELVALVEAGGLDYAFEYRSVAVQHNLKFVDLPKKIDLSSLSYAKFYRRVVVERADGKISIGKPIVYGLTVPRNAPNPKLGIEFVKLVLSEEGVKVFRECGQPPITPAIGIGDIPKELKPFIAFQSIQK